MKARFKDQFIFSIFDKKPQLFNEENFNYDSDQNIDDEEEKSDLRRKNSIIN